MSTLYEYSVGVLPKEWLGLKGRGFKGGFCKFKKKKIAKIGHFEEIDDNMQMRFLTSLSSNIPKTGYLFKFKEKNKFGGHPQGGWVG